MAVPVLGALIAWQWRCGHGTRNRVNSIARWLLVVATTLALLLVANMPSVKQRIQMAQSEWTGWVQTGESNNSVGQRLAHWQFAWHMFTQKPLTGWGQIDYDAERIKTINEGHTPESLRHFNHAHNEWLDMAAKRGAVGLLGLAIFFGVPGWLYIRRMRQDPDSITRTLALCGLATVLGYLVFGLTQVMFAHNAGNMIYLFMNTLWLGALAQKQQEPGYALPI